MPSRLISTTLILLTLASGANALSLPTFTDILPPIKMPAPQDTMSTRGK